MRITPSECDCGKLHPGEYLSTTLTFSLFISPPLFLCSYLNPFYYSFVYISTPFTFSLFISPPLLFFLCLYRHPFYFLLFTLLISPSFLRFFAYISTLFFSVSLLYLSFSILFVLFLCPTPFLPVAIPPSQTPPNPVATIAHLQKCDPI